MSAACSEARPVGAVAEAAEAAAAGVRILPCGDTAFTVEFGDTVDRRLSAMALALAARLDAAAIPGVLARIPTFRSLLVQFDPLCLDGDELRLRLADMARGLGGEQAPGRLWRLPSCYHPELAPDLEDVARRLDLSVGDLIELHRSVTYHIYMLGFLPGLPYLGDMPARLALPRRESPRMRVPAGSVAIAMNLTDIYTFESPCGWHLIARTPAWLWDGRRSPPALVAPGDKVVFEPISPDSYNDLAAAARAGTLVIEPEAPA